MNQLQQTKQEEGNKFNLRLLSTNKMARFDTEEVDKQSSQHFGKGIKVEVSSDKEEGFTLNSPPGFPSKKRKMSSTEYRTLVAADRHHLLIPRPLPPELWQGFVANDAVDALYRDQWWPGTVRKALPNTRYRVYIDDPPDVIDFEGKDLRVHWEWVGGKWVRPENQEETEGSLFSSGAAVEVSLGGENSCDVWFPAIVVKEYADNTFLVKYQLSKDGDDSGKLKVNVDSLHIRPPHPEYVDKSYRLQEIVDVFCDTCWQAGVITKVLAGKRYNLSFKYGIADKELCLSEIRLHVDWIDGKWVVKPKENSHERKRKKGRQSLMNAGPKAQKAVLQRASIRKIAKVSETDCVTKEVDMAFTCVSSNSSDYDKPLSTLFGGKNSPRSVDEPSRTMKGGTEVKERETDVATDDNERLPFTKRSPLWKEIESTEIFQKLPQNPHFGPLGRSEELCREGSAIGMVVTFAGLLDKISKLQLDDPRSKFNRCLETLLDLEKHGFDITVPRARVSRLLAIKDVRGEPLQSESKDAGRVMADLNDEKAKFDEKIEEIGRKINELQEEQAAMKATRESKELEIAKSQSQVDTINLRICSVRGDFEKIATGPWKKT